jgi:MFS family permease
MRIIPRHLSRGAGPKAPAAARASCRWALAVGLYNAATNTLFTRAIWLIYLAAHGYSPFAIGLFEMGYHVAKAAAEVPTGIFADLMGRRASLIVAGVIGALAELLFLAPATPLIALSLALSGMAQAFRGGAHEAMLWTLPEQRLARARRPHPRAHLRTGLRAVRRDPVILGLLLLSGLTEIGWTTIGFYNQLYFHGLGFALAAVGLITAAGMVPDALGTAAAPRLMRYLPARQLLPACVLGEILGLLAMSLGRPAPGLLGYLGLFVSAGAVLYTALSTYLNQRIPEAQRATVLSLQTGLYSAGMIVLFPLFGLGVTYHSYATVYRWSLIALATGSIAIFSATRRLMERKGKD